MRRFGMTLVLLLGWVGPVCAAPHWITAVPRAVGRTYGNMFTFKNPVLALEQWASVGALVFDEKTTMDVFRRCATCVETSFVRVGLRNGRYGIGLATAEILVGGTAYATFEQYGDELLRHDTNKFWRNINNALVAIPLGVHVPAGIHNMRIPATTACIDPDHDCERAPDRD